MHVAGRVEQAADNDRNTPTRRARPNWWIVAPLVWAVPSVADLLDRTLPRGLEPAAVGKLLTGGGGLAHDHLHDHDLTA